MAKAKSEKAIDLTKAVLEAAESQPVKNNPSASRDQVPPGQSGTPDKVYQVVQGPADVVPVANDPSASRNQVPPGQVAQPDTYKEAAPQTVTAQANNPEQSRNQVPPVQNVVQIAEQKHATPVYRDPTDAEIESYIEKKWPGKLEQITGFTSGSEHARLERAHGPGFITAFKDGNRNDPRYFSRVTWKELGGNANKEGWREDVKIPPEVLALQNRK